MKPAKLIDNLSGQEFLLNAESTLVGRKEDNTIVVRNRVMSKHHMEIRKTFAGHTLLDLNSSHGVYINDIRLERDVAQRLKDGDRIRVLIIYPEGVQPAEASNGSSTILTRPTAIAKRKLDGNEKNVTVACDFTYRQGSQGILQKLLGAFSKS